MGAPLGRTLLEGVFRRRDVRFMQDMNCPLRVAALAWAKVVGVLREDASDSVQQVDGARSEVAALTLGLAIGRRAFRNFCTSASGRPWKASMRRRAL